MDDKSTLLQALRKRLWKAFECEKETVYHYTDQAGLLGILKDGAIRAHSTRYMNDPSEGQCARSLWWDSLESHPGARDVWKTVWEKMGIESFCASFSIQRDLLSQWRGYGADGSGFAMGFHPEGFHPDRTTLNGCVLYTKPEQTALIERTLSEHAPFLDEVVGEPILEDLARLAMLDLDDFAKAIPTAFLSMVACLLVYESMMKDSAYEEEREYRRVFLVPKPQIGDADIEFGISPRGLRPYVEMPFWNGDDHFLKEIVVGPLLPFEDTRRTLSMLLERERYGNVEIRPSEIPHRR